jgi:hypothetical protein
MLRSYAITFTGVIIRIYIGAGHAFGIPFKYNYPVSLWLSFLTSIVGIEMVLRWRQVRAAIISLNGSSRNLRSSGMPVYEPTISEHTFRSGSL